MDEVRNCLISCLEEHLDKTLVRNDIISNLSEFNLDFPFLERLLLQTMTVNGKRVFALRLIYIMPIYRGLGYFALILNTLKDYCHQNDIDFMIYNVVNEGLMCYLDKQGDLKYEYDENNQHHHYFLIK